MAKILPLFLPLALLAQFQAQPASIRFEQFSTTSGLPNMNVNAIVEDSLGFLWIGTWEGLARYDGYSMQVYRSSPKDSTSISHNRIESLHLGSRGELWVGTWYGLNRYEPASGGFRRHLTGGGGLPLRQVNTILEDGRRRLWVGTQASGLHCLDLQSGRWELVLSSPDAPVNLMREQIRTLLEDRQGSLWIGTGEPFDAAAPGSGLYHFDPATGALRHYRHDPADPFSLLDDHVSALYEDQEGRIWVGTCQSGLHLYDAAGDRFLRLPAQDTGLLAMAAPAGRPLAWATCLPLRFIRQDSRGAFWIGTYNGGVARFEPSTGARVLLRHDSGDPFSLSENQVWAFHEGRFGNIWIGSFGGGVQKYDPFARKFGTMRHDPGDPGSLSGNFITGIHQSKINPDEVWIGTRGAGLNRLDLRSGAVTRYPQAWKGKGSLSGNTAWCILESRSGDLWIGTEGGLDRIEAGSGRFHHYRHDPADSTTLSSNEVLCLFEDSRGRLWAGAWQGGLNRFDPKAGGFRRYPLPESTYSTSARSVYAIYEDEGGAIWVGAWFGALYRLDPETGEMAAYLEGSGANWMYPAGRGRFWVATNDQGLVYFDAGSGPVRNYTTADGLPSNTVQAILGDQAGWLWLGTGNGLARFDPQTGQCITFDESDGLPGVSFNLLSACHLADGRMLFGTSEGLALFHPGEVQQNPVPPRVLITGFRIGKPGRGPEGNLLFQPLAQHEGLKLSYEENSLSFEYVGLHFSGPANNRYRYRLEPYDEQWVEAGEARSARYNNLQPGEYVFQVSAANSDGIWSPRPASMRFRILPPWWGTWWFRIGAALAVLAAAFGLYKLRIAQVRREAQLKLALERRLARVEMDALRAQMNPHFLFNCLNSIDHYILKNETLKASEYLGHFARLVRLTLQNSRANFISLSDELETLRLYLTMESLRFPGQFDYDIQVDAALNPANAEIPPMLLQPFVENAIWHGLMPKKEGGRVTIAVAAGDHYLLCTVEDNGVGREQAKEFRRNRPGHKKSYGMQITRDRIQLFNDLYRADASLNIIDLNNGQGEAAGTRVEIRLPRF